MIDAWVVSNNPNQNNGPAARLRLNGSGTGDDRQAFIFFPRTFIKGATIIDATLKVYLAGAWSGTTVITAKRVTETWREGKITWNNRPAVVTTHSAQATVVDGSRGDEVTFDLTAMLQDVADGQDWYGVRLEIDRDVNLVLYASECLTVDLRPHLAVEWSQAPDPPSSLVPGGGQIIGTGLPLLKWKFTDSAGNTKQASSQVQIDSVGDFVTPEYDSGKVANVQASWDLADTAYAGVPAGSTRYWRVMVWDETDFASDWSDITAMDREGQGTVTLVSPGATVDDRTPPIDWTFSATQERYEVVLFEIGADPNNPAAATQLYSTGQVVSIDTVAAIPAGYIKTGHTYRVRLRVWDDQDRVSTPSDPAYVEVTQDFTYVRNATPTAPSGLTATVVDSGVQLEWTRATQPDYWDFTVDGEEVLRIDGDEAFVSGTTYRYTVYLGAPGVSQTFGVEAVVNSSGALHNSDPATATATPGSGGIWLVDPDDGTQVEIIGTSGLDLGIGESGTTFNLVGTRKSKRITDSVRGYEGTVAGQIEGDTAKDNFLALKGRLKTLRLIVGSLNVPVILEEVEAVTPLALPEPRYAVSFRVVQVDEFGDVMPLAGGIG